MHPDTMAVMPRPQQRAPAFARSSERRRGKASHARYGRGANVCRRAIGRPSRSCIREKAGATRLSLVSMQLDTVTTGPPRVAHCSPRLRAQLGMTRAMAVDTRIALDSGTPGDECLKIPRFAAGRHGRRVGGQCSSAMGASIGTRMGWSGSASQSKAWVDAGSREVRFSRCGLHLPAARSMRATRPS